MVDKKTSAARRTAVKKMAYPAAALSVWGSPIVQSVLLPVHAETTFICEPVAIPGRWQLEVLGPAASTSEITFFSDGSVDHSFVNAWQFGNGEFQMTQGTTWEFIGSFSACDTLSGIYVNVFTIPVLGNVIVRQGTWYAVKLR